MQIEQVIIAVLLVTIIYLINKILEKNKSINLLHLENESCLNLLSELGAIPPEILENKILKMNQKYGKIKLKI